MVNANVAFCCGVLGVGVPGTERFLGDKAADQDFSSNYGVSPHFPLYLLTRACTDGPVPGLESMLAALQDFALTRLPPPPEEASAFNVACLAAGLLNAGATAPVVAPYLDALLDRQDDDGSWPAWGAYLGFGGRYDGAPALTTAVAVDALAKAARP